MVQHHSRGEQDGIDRVGKAQAKQRARLPLLGASVLAIIVVTMHIVSAVFLATTNFHPFAPPNLLWYFGLGLFMVVAIVKLTHAIGVMHGKTRSVRDSAHGGGRTGDEVDQPRQDAVP